MSFREISSGGPRRSSQKVSSELNLKFSVIYICLSTFAGVGTSKRTETGYEVSRNSDGLPLFPKINLDKDGLDVIRKVMEGYLIYLWGPLSVINY
jgi:hypothetical protein